MQVDEEEDAEEEEEEAEAEVVIPRPTKEELAAAPRPTFEAVIEFQASSGYWDSTAEDTLASCITGGEISDQAIKQTLIDQGIEGETLENAYVTLLALFLLQEAFFAKKSEWSLIARKAKEYLQRDCGIQKPLSLVKKFQFAIKPEEEDDIEYDYCYDEEE